MVALPTMALYLSVPTMARSQLVHTQVKPPKRRLLTSSVNLKRLHLRLPSQLLASQVARWFHKMHTRPSRSCASKFANSMASEISMRSLHLSNRSSHLLKAIAKHMKPRRLPMQLRKLLVVNRFWSRKRRLLPKQSHSHFPRIGRSQATVSKLSSMNGRRLLVSIRSQMLTSGSVSQLPAINLISAAAPTLHS
ncbi:unannotated protein [freshwater metagenome]|uniref:Unannotated protein n=1 Tax=freshwater metagenome TaxID=449393 RepID=A0A6J7TMU8_9ZZZZ